MPNGILLFDGDCAFCERSVTFVARRDPRAYFLFGAAQTPEAAEILARHGVAADTGQTIVLIEDGRVYTKSTAALRVAKRMRWPWPIAAAFLLVPRFVRDAVYMVVSRNRHRLVNDAVCAVPPPELRGRIITR